MTPVTLVGVVVVVDVEVPAAHAGDVHGEAPQPGQLRHPHHGRAVPVLVTHLHPRLRHAVHLDTAVTTVDKDIFTNIILFTFWL